MALPEWQCRSAWPHAVGDNETPRCQENPKGGTNILDVLRISDYWRIRGASDRRKALERWKIGVLALAKNRNFFSQANKCSSARAGHSAEGYDGGLAAAKWQ